MPTKSGCFVHVIDSETKKPAPEIVEEYYGDGLPTVVVRPGMRLVLKVKGRRHAERKKHKLSNPPKAFWLVRFWFDGEFVITTEPNIVNGGCLHKFETFSCGSTTFYKPYFAPTRKLGVEVKDAEKNDDDYDEFDSQMQIAVRLQHVTSGLGRSNASPSEPTKRKPVKFDCDIETPAQDQEIQVKYDEKMKPYHATNVKLCAGSEVKSKTKGVRDMTYVETGESVTITFRCDTEDNIKMRALNWKAQQKAKIRKDQAQLPPQPQPEHDDSLSALKDYASDVEDATDIHKAPREILDLTIEDDENKAQLKEKCSECDEEMKNSSATNWCSECENICIALKRNKRSANVGIWSNKKHKFLRNGPESKLSHDLIIVIDSRVTEMNFRVQFLSFSFVSIRFR